MSYGGGLVVGKEETPKGSGTVQCGKPKVRMQGCTSGWVGKGIQGRKASLQRLQGVSTVVSRSKAISAKTRYGFVNLGTATCTVWSGWGITDLGKGNEAWDCRWKGNLHHRQHESILKKKKKLLDQYSGFTCLCKCYSQYTKNALPSLDKTLSSLIIIIPQL